MYSGVESVDASVMVEVVWYFVFYLCACSRASRRSRSPGAHAPCRVSIISSPLEIALVKLIGRAQWY